VATDEQNAKNARKASTETVMLRQTATDISDNARSPASSAGDWHDVNGHHRYYGSSAVNGGERIAETRRGPRPTGVNLFDFD
jgi:hypothetical protein